MIFISTIQLKMNLVIWKIVHPGVNGHHGVFVLKDAMVKEVDIVSAICLRYLYQFLYF